MVTIEKTTYPGYGGCYRLSNGSVELFASIDVGPRIACYRFIGCENILAELGPDKKVDSELGIWYSRGGSRLWHAPEVMPRSYSPDNDPVECEMVGSDSVRLVQPVEPETKIQKEILIKLNQDGSGVTITSKLTNRGLWPVELAPWNPSVMRGGGFSFFPQEPFISHDDYLLPSRPMVLWHFTDMTDPRWTFGKKYVRLQSDDRYPEPQKIGAAVKLGWAGYYIEDTLFVKRFPYFEDVEYPDYGCNFETYCAGSFLEVETLAPLAVIGQDESVTHVEKWYLFKGVETGDSEESFDKAIMPYIEQTVE
ncbi:hypothetical protein LLG46_13370 [bacterium]|nr:hypothetical protein [bacterium]